MGRDRLGREGGREGRRKEGRKERRKEGRREGEEGREGGSFYSSGVGEPLLFLFRAAQVKLREGEPLPQAQPSSSSHRIPTTMLSSQVIFRWWTRQETAAKSVSSAYRAKWVCVCGINSSCPQSDPQKNHPFLPE